MLQNNSNKLDIIEQKKLFLLLIWKKGYRLCYKTEIDLEIILIKLQPLTTAKIKAKYSANIMPEIKIFSDKN